MYRFVLWSAVLCSCILVLGVAQATASVVVFGTCTEYSGATAPQGPSPWLTATYDDGGSAGAVTVTLEATNLVGTEFASGLYLNVADGIDPNDLVFTKTSHAGDFDLPTVFRGIDQFKADGGGDFDVFLEFATGGSMGNRFTAGDSITYVITGLPDLTVASFDVACISEGKPGIYHMAVHVQGIGSDGELSGWVSAPEPVSAALLAIGCLAYVRRRSR